MVLVIVANPTVGMMICSLLRSWGMHAEQAEQNLATALTTTEFDLMIAEETALDPDLASLRYDACAAGIPWLALLSSASDRRRVEATHWIQTPFQIQELQDGVIFCLRGSPEASTTLGVDTDAIVALWDSIDNPIFCKVVQVFGGEMAERLQAIATAIATECRRGLLIEAHSIGSAADNVGCAAVAHAARALEVAALTATDTKLLLLAREVQHCAWRDLPILFGLAGVEA